MLARDHQRVAARGGGDVHEGDRALVFVDDLRGQLAGDDLAEDAIGVAHRREAYWDRLRASPARSCERRRAPARASRPRRRSCASASSSSSRPSCGPGAIPSSRAELVAAHAAARGGPWLRQRSASASSSPREPQVRVDRLARRALAARREAVGDRQQRDVDLDRRARAQVAVDASARASGCGSCTRKPRRRWWRASAATCARSRSLARSRPSTSRASSAPRASWPMNVTRPSAGRTARVERLGGVVQQRAQAQRLAARQLVGERLGEQRGDRAARCAARSRAPRPRRAAPPLAPSQLDACGRAPRACGRRRRGGGKRLCSTPRSAVELGQHDASARRARPSARCPRERLRRGDDPPQLGEDALGRDAGRAPGALARRGARSAGSGSSSSSTRAAPAAAPAAGRRAKAARRGHAQAPRAPGPRAPPSGSIGSPPASGSAIALTVKSRSARSASSVPPRSGARSACQRAVARDDAPRAELLRQREAAAPPGRARDRARRLAPGRPRRRRRGRRSARPSSAVADRAADEPRPAAGQRRASRVEARRHARRQPRRCALRVDRRGSAGAPSRW